jgi:hypothetical protein
MRQDRDRFTKLALAVAFSLNAQLLDNRNNATGPAANSLSP